MGSSESFRDLAALLDTEVINSTINIPLHKGSGSIQKIQVSRGLQVTSWNICLNDSIQLIKIPALPGTNRVFTLTYIFSKNEVLFSSSSSEREVRLNGQAYLLFDPGNQDTNFTLFPHAETHALIVSMETKWLEEEFDGLRSGDNDPMRQLISNTNPFIYYKPVERADFKKASELFIHFVSDTHDMFYIKGNLLLLLSNFFKEFFLNNHNKPAENHVLHFEKMTRVEKILTSHLAADLPPIHQIARDVAMSESTLKRCFRLTYGTSMYDYYLQKKMEYAKVQLTEKKLPVKEVAYMLGYENPGSFIRIFKKHFRLPPGVMQKEDRKLLMKSKKN